MCWDEMNYDQKLVLLEKKLELLHHSLVLLLIARNGDDSSAEGEHGQLSWWAAHWE